MSGRRRGRSEPPRRDAGLLRLAAVPLGLLARAGRGEHAAVLAVAVALAGVVEAVADRRAVQPRAAQAAAACQAAEALPALPASSPPGGHLQRGPDSD